MSALVHTAALLTSGSSSDSVLKLSVLGHIGDGSLGDEDQAGNRSSVLQGDAADLDGVEDAHLNHVAPLAVGRVESLAGRQLGNLVDHDSALKTSVLGDGSDRSGQSLLDDVDTDLLLGVVELNGVERRSSIHEGDAAASDNALLDSSAGSLQGVLDAVLDLLELGLGSSADLDDGNATGELGQALLELLAVEVRGGVLHLTLDLSDTSVDGLLGASATDDDGVVLGDGDGSQPLMSQFYGAGEEKSLKQTKTLAYEFSMVLAVISAILIYLLRGKIGLLFGSSAEVNAGVIKVMPIFLVSVPFDAITRVSTAAFYATEKSVLSYVLTFIEPIIMLVLMLMLPPVFGGQIMIWWSAVFAKVITASVSIVLSVRYSAQRNR